VTNAPASTYPNAARSDSWCRQYVLAASRLVPLSDSPLPPAAEVLPEWLKRSKPLTHPLPLPADGPRTPAEGARKPRKPTLVSVAKQASKAAIPVARYEVKPDGTVVVVTGAPEQQQGNEVDDWIAKHAHAPERH
jgi:hypothetical protein